MKEISLIIKDENEFIDVANYQLNEFIKYNDIIKEKKYTMGTDGEEIKNILGLNILFLLFKISITEYICELSNCFTKKFKFFLYIFL